MKITSKALAWVCVGLLVLYPTLALLVWAYPRPAADDYDGVMAALFALNAGTALFVGLIFGLPQFSNHTSRAMKLSVGVIGVFCALMSGMFWMTDEVDSLLLRLLIISPILVTLYVLGRFVEKVTKEAANHKDEDKPSK